jgi:hypothetical protein
MTNSSRLLNTETGQLFISILLGLGLATLFRKVCKDKNCIKFNGPVISEVDGKTYQFGEYCYKYELFPTKCDPLKKTVHVNDSQAKSLTKQEDEKESSSFFGF